PSAHEAIVRERRFTYSPPICLGGSAPCAPSGMAPQESQTMSRASLRSNVGVIIIAATLLAGGSPAGAREDADPGRVRLATGQFITPTAVRGATQQFLNPGLPNYPNFVAGEAVRSALSPDGTTLAILCAGQNSLDFPAGLASYPPGKNPGDLDVANS